MIEFEPLFFSEQGLRENNEDAFLCDITNKNVRFCIVCDGVGGSQRGEVASSLACRTVADYIRNNELPLSFELYVNKMIDAVDTAFDQYFEMYPDAMGMGTTLTLLLFFDNRAIAVHIGDSRIYHVRKNKILFETRDHSLVNVLIDNKVITEAEAQDHPQKNVIMRAILGKSIKASEADVHVISEINSGDYFLLCSDGILESVDSKELIQILSLKIADEDKLNEIKKRCQTKSKDNYTAVLIPIR